jgi:hypothetical protein
LRSQGLAERGPASLRGFGSHLVHERTKAGKINCVQRAIGRLSTQESLARPIQPAIRRNPNCRSQLVSTEPGIPSGHHVSFVRGFFLDFYREKAR